MAVRGTAGFNTRVLAERLGVSQSTVARIERGERMPSSVQIVQAWLRECRPREGYPAGVRDRILALYRAATGETRSWTELLDGHLHLQDVASRRNQRALAAYNVQTVVLPGLVQTGVYARRALTAVAAAHGLPPGDLDAAVEARLARQAILREPGRQFRFLIAERLLRFVPGPPSPEGDDWENVMRPQLERLVEVAQLAAVHLAVLPDSVGNVVWHPFILREPADQSPPYVTVELIHGEQELHDVHAVEVYRGLWSQLWSAAWSEADSLAHISAQLAR